MGSSELSSILGEQSSHRDTRDTYPESQPRDTYPELSSILDEQSSHATPQPREQGSAKAEMCCSTEAGSYLRLIDSCITQL